MFSVKSLQCCLVTIYGNSGGYIILSEAACVSLFDKYISDHQTTLSITENSGNLNHWLPVGLCFLLPMLTQSAQIWMVVTGEQVSLWPDSKLQEGLLLRVLPGFLALRQQEGRYLVSMFLPPLSLCKYLQWILFIPRENHQLLCLCQQLDLYIYRVCFHIHQMDIIYKHIVITDF